MSSQRCDRFLASTHYTHYDPWLFAINITALIFVLIPKLPVVSIQSLTCPHTFRETSHSVPSVPRTLHGVRGPIHDRHSRHTQLSTLRHGNTLKRLRILYTTNQPQRSRSKTITSISRPSVCPVLPPVLFLAHLSMTHPRRLG